MTAIAMIIASASSPKPLFDQVRTRTRYQRGDQDPRAGSDRPSARLRSAKTRYGSGHHTRSTRSEPKQAGWSQQQDAQQDHQHDREQHADVEEADIPDDHRLRQADDEATDNSSERRVEPAEHRRHRCEQERLEHQRERETGGWRQQARGERPDRSGESPAELQDVAYRDADQVRRLLIVGDAAHRETQIGLAEQQPEEDAHHGEYGDRTQALDADRARPGSE